MPGNTTFSYPSFKERKLKVNRRAHWLEVMQLWRPIVSRSISIKGELLSPKPSIKNVASLLARQRYLYSARAKSIGKYIGPYFFVRGFRNLPCRYYLLEGAFFVTAGWGTDLVIGDRPRWPYQATTQTGCPLYSIPVVRFRRALPSHSL